MMLVFLLGGGYPYLVIPEVSLSANDDTQRWYANYKLGLDDGFSAGFEQAVSDNKKHALARLWALLAQEIQTKSAKVQLMM